MGEGPAQMPNILQYVGDSGYPLCDISDTLSKLHMWNRLQLC